MIAFFSGMKEGKKTVLKIDKKNAKKLEYGILQLEVND